MTHPTDRLDDLEDFPQEGSAITATPTDELEDLEDFPQTAPPRRRGGRARRVSRRTMLLVGGGALLLGGLAGTWYALGTPGLTPEPSVQPNQHPDDPSMNVTEVPVEDIVSDPADAQQSAPDAQPGDVFPMEPVDLPEGLVGHRQDDGMWVVVQDASPQEQQQAVAERIAASVADTTTGEFDGEKMGAMMLTFEQQDAVHYAATGTPLLVTYPANGSYTAWAAVRGETGAINQVFTAIDSTPEAAEASLRGLAKESGIDIGDRHVINVAG